VINPLWDGDYFNIESLGEFRAFIIFLLQYWKKVKKCVFLALRGEKAIFGFGGLKKMCIPGSGTQGEKAIFGFGGQGVKIVMKSH
jgi:hypothetical protein